MKRLKPGGSVEERQPSATIMARVMRTFLGLARGLEWTGVPLYEMHFGGKTEIYSELDECGW